MSATDDKLQRELDLRFEIQTRLPQFVLACESTEANMLLLHQHAFAADYQEEEFALLGRAIKYAGLLGKDVTIVADRSEPNGGS